MNTDSLLEKLKGTAGIRESVTAYIRQRRADRKAAAEALKAQGVTDAQIAPLLAIDAEDDVHAEEIAAAIVEVPQA